MKQARMNLLTASSLSVVSILSLPVGCTSEFRSQNWFAGEPPNQEWFVEEVLPTSQVPEGSAGMFMRSVGAGVVTTVRPASARISRPPDYPGQGLQEALSIMRSRFPSAQSGPHDTDLTNLKAGESVIVTDGARILGGHCAPMGGIVVRRRSTELVFDLWEHRRFEAFPPLVAIK